MRRRSNIKIGSFYCSILRCFVSEELSLARTSEELHVLDVSMNVRGTLAQDLNVFRFQRRIEQCSVKILIFKLYVGFSGKKQAMFRKHHPSGDIYHTRNH